MNARLRLVSPDGQVLGERTLTQFPARVGRDPSGEVPVDEARFPMVSGTHAELSMSAAGLSVAPRSQKNRTLVNDVPIDGPTSLRVGDRIRLGLTGPAIHVLAIVSATAVTRESGSTLAADAEQLAALRSSGEGFIPTPIGEGGIIGRDPEAKFRLSHPIVSRKHATVRVVNGRTMLTDASSANGTFVNGRQIWRPTELAPGDIIDVGPFSLVFDGESLAGASRSDNVELIAWGVSRVVKDRATGKPLKLLKDITLVVKPREFVCLLGPSGSGKSTLLGALSGRVPPDEGVVLVNGQDLHANFDALKRDIAMVPQKDVLHDSLAVGTALRYTAELRLPPDTGRAELHQAVAEMLGVVGLTKRKETLIRHLSGGQVKRASLANELICKPTLLFLDEVTSGLDEQTDRDMMELFRQVADAGKTVVCITHNLANVEATCHLVAILTEGGRLAFYGPPEEAKRYFGVVRLGEVYRKLASRPADDWEADFLRSPFYTELVANRLPAENTPAARANYVDGRTRANPLRQALVLVRRYTSVWKGDALALLAMLGQAFLVALLLGIVFGDLPGVKNPVERAQRTVNLLFLLNVSCFWLGCNNSAKELVRERTIYRRERDINLRTDSYYISKYLVLLSIAFVQVALLFGIVRPWCAPDGAAIGQFLVLFALSATGTALGLLISAASPTEEVATAMVPVAVIPQIILAGVIAPLSGLGKLLGYVAITCFWGRRGLEALLPDETIKMLDRDDVAALPQLMVVGLHAAIIIGTTMTLLWYQARLEKMMIRWGR